MAEFEQAMTVRASADQVFDFVADVQNMPKYLPTTKSAQSQGPDRVRVQGEARGTGLVCHLRAPRARPSRGGLV